MFNVFDILWFVHLDQAGIYVKSEEKTSIY